MGKYRSQVLHGAAAALFATVALTATGTASAAEPLVQLAQTAQEKESKDGNPLSGLFGAAAGLLGGTTGVGGDTTQKLVGAAGTMLDAADDQIGPADEFYIGRAAAAQIIGSARTLPQNHPASVYVSNVGDTLVRASRAPHMFKGYSFILIEDANVNAYAAPGGIIMITTGMLGFVQDEDELAFILGHEIGHVEMEHGTIDVAREKRTKATRQATSAVVSAAASQTGAAGGLLNTVSEEVMGQVISGIRNGYSAEVEGEADMRGIATMARAGYDSRAAVAVIERFRSFRGNYGGAGYPEQRGPTIARAAQAQPAVPAAARGVRAARFARALRSRG